MNSRKKANDVARANRISRWHPYADCSPAASSASGESSSSSTVPSKRPPVVRNALSSTFRAPRAALAMRSAPLEFVSIVRAEHGLSVPRRDAANGLLSKEDKLRSARCLVERAIYILQNAWKTVETSPFPIATTTSGNAAATPSVNYQSALPPPYDGSQYPYQSTTEHMSLGYFTHEILRRSCTNFITLQTALCYIEAVADRLPSLVKEEVEFMHKRAETYYAFQSDRSHRLLPDPLLVLDEHPEVPPLPSPLLCPRRTFVASILLASKFIQDRSYSTNAWGKLTGLPAPEVGRCERVLLAALDYRLWVGKGSEPAPVIEGLDMAPVIADDAAYQPEVAREPPQMLRKTPSNVTLASRFASAEAVNVPRPPAAMTRWLHACKVPSAPHPPAKADEKSVAGPSNWNELASVPAWPAPIGRQLSCSQESYADNVSSSSLSPESLCYSQSSAGSVGSSEVITPPEDMYSGLHGHHESPPFITP